MLIKKISILKIAAMYMGAVIGAGFASGQEIMQFIIVHGKNGLNEVILITCLFCYFGSLILFLSVKLGADNYLTLINFLVGKRVGKIIDIISILMLLGGLSVMLSGSGAIFNEHFNIANWYGILIIAIINCIIILFGFEGVLWINTIFVPIKIIAILIISLLIIYMENTFGFINNTTDTYFTYSSNWGFSGILYVSYNIILVIAVLSTLGKAISGEKAIAGGMLGGIGLGFVAGVIFLAGLSLYPTIAGYKIPMLYMAGVAGYGLKNIMGLLIWMAILTTTIANAHGFAARMAEAGSEKYKIIGVGATFFSIPLANMDFDRLVGLVYPIFGYAGLLIMIVLISGHIGIILRKRKNFNF